MSQKIDDGLNAKSRYDKQFKAYKLKLHRERDAELIEWLKAQNVNNLFKTLLLREMQK